MLDRLGRSKQTRLWRAGLLGWLYHHDWQLAAVLAVAIIAYQFQRRQKLYEAALTEKAKHYSTISPRRAPIMTASRGIRTVSHG